MPKYKYKCKDCEHSFDVFHLTSEVVEKCPNCQSCNIRRDISNERDLRLTKTVNNDKKVGSVTKKYIEELKEDFHKYVDESKKNREEQ